MFYIYMNHLKRTSNDISFGYFMLTLDWLYLLNLVELTENGDIKNVIKNLKIFSNGIEIRNIPFKTGLNLILDNETILGTESGNSIGKTTLLRIVDYCLGSDGKDIYTDPEFKTEYNTEVYNFVQNNQVSAQLELTLRNNTNIILERNLIIEGEKYYKINDEEISSITKYREKLSELIFKNKASKPSLRQLVPKFIRSDASKCQIQLCICTNLPLLVNMNRFFVLFGFPEPTLFLTKAAYLGNKRL